MRPVAHLFTDLFESIPGSGAWTVDLLKEFMEYIVVEMRPDHPTVTNRSNNLQSAKQFAVDRGDLLQNSGVKQFYIMVGDTSDEKMVYLEVLPNGVERAAPRQQ